MRGPLIPFLAICWTACTGCASDYTRPTFGAPHVLTGDWIGSTSEYGVMFSLSVRDSGRSDPSGVIPSRFVRGSGRYSLFANGAEDDFDIPPYEVRLQSQMDPFSLTLWSYATPGGVQRSLEFRGTVLSSTQLSGWLVRTQTLPNNSVQKDSATLVMLRDGT